MRRTLALVFAASLAASGCFVDRAGTLRAGTDASAGIDAGMDGGGGDPDAGFDAGFDAGAPYDANCAPGTVDVDRDPTNGCECTIASPPTELCNGRDDDCDPSTFDGQDEALLMTACDGADEDRCRDGFWVCNVDALACTDPLEDSVEICGNTIDEDCDGAFDESAAADAPTWYRDLDGDGHGDAATSTRACTMPPGYVADATDCDDMAPARSPSTPETCNGRDDDCSGLPTTRAAPARSAGGAVCPTCSARRPTGTRPAASASPPAIGS